MPDILDVCQINGMKSMTVLYGHKKAGPLQARSIILPNAIENGTIIRDVKNYIKKWFDCADMTSIK